MSLSEKICVRATGQEPRPLVLHSIDCSREGIVFPRKGVDVGRPSCRACNSLFLQIPRKSSCVLGGSSPSSTSSNGLVQSETPCEDTPMIVSGDNSAAPEVESILITPVDHSLVPDNPTPIIDLTRDDDDDHDRVVRDLTRVRAMTSFFITLNDWVGKNAERLIKCCRHRLNK